MCLQDSDPLSVQTRYYFHLVRGRERILDRVGLRLSRDVVMSPAAVDKVRERWPGTANRYEWEGWSVEIVDDSGEFVRTLTLP